MLLNGLDEKKLKTLLDQLEENTHELMSKLEYLPGKSSKGK